MGNVFTAFVDGMRLAPFSRQKRRARGLGSGSAGEETNKHLANPLRNEFSVKRNNSACEEEETYYYFP